MLIDPWLSTKLEEEDGRSRARVAPALRPEEVEAADLVCVTHEHADHLDPRTLARDRRARRRTRSSSRPRRRSALVERPACRAGGSTPRSTASRSRPPARASPRCRAAHELHPDAFGGYRFWLDEHGDHRAPQLPGRARRPRASSTRATRSGGPGWRTRCASSTPDVAILPINGRDAMRERDGLWGNLSADEAAALAAAAGVPAVVPCHFDGVAGNLGDPDAFVARAARARAGDPRARAAPGGPASPRGMTRRARVAG